LQKCLELFLENIDELLGELNISDMPSFPMPPEKLIGMHGQRLAIFHSPAYGFSNSYPAPFTMLGRHFHTIDQYFIWQKARYFGDADMAAQMLLNNNPVKIRRLSHRIREFRLGAWKTVRDNVRTPTSHCHAHTKIHH
jgi:predicted NAD-dependent protein-ADP-ribosyltransferase YbiA (DUF1768 family)